MIHCGVIVGSISSNLTGPFSTSFALSLRCEVNSFTFIYKVTLWLIARSLMLRYRNISSDDRDMRHEPSRTGRNG